VTDELDYITLGRIWLTGLRTLVTSEYLVEVLAEGEACFASNCTNLAAIQNNHKLVAEHREENREKCRIENSTTSNLTCIYI
jgi:hypothetical protein